MGSQASETPMMAQYLRIKRRHKDSLLFFRLGDFYELFFEDAQLASRVLGITLTSRSKGPDAVPMAGVPYHSAESYIHRLVRAGHRVAICEQVQDAEEAKGLVERDVTRVVTAGTITEMGMLDERRNNYLAAVCPGKTLLGVSWIDLSTGEFYVQELSFGEFAGAFSRIQPAECLLADRGAHQDFFPDATLLADCQVLARPAWTFRVDTGREALCEHFGTKTLDGFGCGGLTCALGAASAILHYLQETQQSNLGQITAIRHFRTAHHLLLDYTTQRSLELMCRIRDGQREGSLIHVMDRTVTPMGARLLRKWMLAPLRQKSAIDARLAAVEKLLDDPARLKGIREQLRGVYDLERLAARVASGRANPRDMVALRHSLERIPTLRQKLGSKDAVLLVRMYEALDPVEEASRLIAKSLRDAPPIHIREGGILRECYDPEVDELRRLASSGKTWIAEYRQRLIKETGISNLKVGFNKVFGYYIEVTHARRDAVPEVFVRKQTLKNAERYITPDLKRYESKVLGAEERVKHLEYHRFLEIRDKVALMVERILSSALAVSELDVMCSLAQLARERHYVLPSVVQEPVLDIEEGRHPVVEAMPGSDPFVPNDVKLGEDGGTLMIITGPNMAGKSTYIRQVAILTLMAHMGSYVPARRATIGLVDGIFTRIGASDDLSGGKSTFMVEMTETANILNHATAQSLVILDEVGRGTSTFDGISIAWAITEFLAAKLGPRTLFATHYHELTELSRSIENVTSWNVDVREWEGDVVFLHKIVPGGADKSYGIHVARLCGVPPAVLERAKEVLCNLERSKLDADNLSRLAKTNDGAVSQGEVQLDLFASRYQELADHVRSLAPDETTPRQALALLYELKAMV